MRVHNQASSTTGTASIKPCTAAPPPPSCQSFFLHPMRHKGVAHLIKLHRELLQASAVQACQLLAARPPGAAGDAGGQVQPGQCRQSRHGLHHSRYVRHLDSGEHRHAGKGIWCRVTMQLIAS